MDRGNAHVGAVAVPVHRQSVFGVETSEERGA